MKKAIIICTLLFLAVYSFGQPRSKKVDVQWGPEFKDSKKATLSDIIGYDETGIYTQKTKGISIPNINPVIYLEHYDHRLAQTKSVKLDLVEQKKQRQFEFIIYLHGKIYVFSSFKNQKLMKNFLFVQSVNKETLELNKDLKKIAEISYDGKSRRNSGEFDYKLSTDSSKVLIFYNLPYDKEKSEKFGFHIFDKDMNQLWQKDITLPYKEALFDIKDYKIDQRGNIHLLGLIYKEKRKKEEDEMPNYKYHILSYLDKGSKLIEYPIDIEDKFLVEMQIAINDEQDIICGGFYSAVGTYSIKGSYFLKIDGKTKEVLSREFQEFSMDLITQNLTEKHKKRAENRASKGKNIELLEYELDNIILKEDGGAILIGEQFFRYTERTSMGSNGSSMTTTYYKYNDIMVVSMSPNGKIEWAVKIPKRQTTGNDRGMYSSYALAVRGDKLHFIFNDNPKNLSYKDGAKLYNFSGKMGSIVVLVTLDREGKQTKETLYSEREVTVLTRPKLCKQISEHEMVLFGEWKGTHRFAKVLFKE